MNCTEWLLCWVIKFSIRFPPSILHFYILASYERAVNSLGCGVSPILKSSFLYISSGFLSVGVCVYDVNYVRYRVFLLFSFCYLLLFRVYFNSFLIAQANIKWKRGDKWKFIAVQWI